MKTIDPSVPAVVFGALAGRVAHGGLGIVRTLGRLGVVVVVAAHEGTLVGRSRYAARAVPMPSAGDAERIDILLRLGHEIGDRPVLIPTDDPSALLVDAHNDVLREVYRFPERSVAMTSALANKIAMRELCRRHGVDTPEIEVICEPADLESFVERARFPVVLKVPAAVTLRRGVDVSVAIVRSARDLAEAFAARPVGAPQLLVQEYIPGGPESVWMFNGYFDASSRCLFGATARKLRQYRPYTGMTSLGECEPNEAVEFATLRLMTELEYRGILDIGFRYDARDGRYKLLDANPRVGATFRLFTGIGGTDVVRALYSDMTEQPVSQDRVRPGRRWMLETHDPVSSLTYIRDGRLGAVEWLRSLRGIDELALFAADDRAPAATAVADMVLPNVDRRVARGTRTRRGPAAANSNRRIQRFEDSKEADWWDAVYERTADPFAAIYQERLQRAVDLLREWHPRARRVLDLGSGAGAMSAALAARGLDVVALDPSPIMHARAAARFAGSLNRPTPVRGDGNALPFADASFDVVSTLGVVPWLDDPAGMLAEARRVLRPDGLLIATADNKVRLAVLLDPWQNPYLSSVRRTLRATLLPRRADGSGAGPAAHTTRQFHDLLRREGFRPVAAETFGFGPLMFARQRMLPEHLTLELTRRLQRHAERGTPVVGRLGSQHLVAAVRKGPTSQPAPRATVEATTS